MIFVTGLLVWFGERWTLEGDIFSASACLKWVSFPSWLSMCLEHFCYRFGGQLTHIKQRTRAVLPHCERALPRCAHTLSHVHSHACIPTLAHTPTLAQPPTIAQHSHDVHSTSTFAQHFHTCPCCTELSASTALLLIFPFPSFLSLSLLSKSKSFRLRCPKQDQSQWS